MYTDWRLALSLAGLLAAGCGVAASLPRFPAQLAGHAILPAATFVAAPPEAPAGFALSGRYAARAGQRIELPESVPAFNGSGASARPTGFALPFVTIESVRVVGDSHVLIANHNNLLFSAGCRLERADDTEFVLLYVPELLRAR
jgi:hypothetical protein